MINAEKYNQAVDLHSDGLYRFALKQLNDTELAKDIVQESFTRLWEKRETVNADKVKSYLFTIAYHLIIETARNQQKKTKLSDAGAISYSGAKRNHELQKILEHGLQKLSDIQRTVLLLRDYEGYNYQEIGEITKLNESQVKVYIFRARIAMREYLGKLENVL